MKRTRITIAVMLLFALLFSACARVAKRMEGGAPEEEASIESAYPFTDFPPGTSKQGAANGQVTPNRAEGTLFNAKFEGDAVSGSGGAVGGTYHFIATETDGESWHVKLEANYPTVAGRDYTVTYRFTSDVSGTVKFGDFQEFQIQEGENTVTGTFTAKDSTSYLDLQLGMLQPFTIDFTEIEVMEYADDVDYVNALPKPVDFTRESKVYERHDQGYETVLVREPHAINVNYEAIPTDTGVWKSRLYVRTGLVPEPGTHYRVTFDVMSDRYERPITFEVLLNDGDVEKGYGALYGQKLLPGEVKNCEAVITGNGNGDELVLQFSLGESRAGAVIVIGNVRVDKIVDHYTNALPKGFAMNGSAATGAIIQDMVPVAYTDLPLSPSFYNGVDTVYEQHDDGYIVSLDETETSATFNIEQAPENPDDRGVWKAKLNVATGAELEPGNTYRLKFDLTPTRDQDQYEICFDGDSENAYGALYGRRFTAGETDHVEILFTPEENLGPLTIRMQLGKTDTADGNSITLENLSLENVKFEYTDVLPASFSYDTGTNEPEEEEELVSVLPDDFSYDTEYNVSELHGEGYTQSVSSTDDTATLTITEAPEEGRDLWNSNLLIDTGVVPEAGTKYLVSFDIEAEKNQPNYEVCFDGNSENAYGALYSQTLTGGEKKTINYTFTPEESNGSLVLRLQLGQTEDTSGNTFTVSNISVATVTSEVTEQGNVSEDHDNGLEQTVSANGSAATLDITQACDDSGGVWSSRLYIKTGVTPEAGKRYRVIATVSSDKAIDGYEMLCDNTGSDIYGGAWELSNTAGETKTVTAEFTAPDSDCGELVLRFQMGNSPADNTIKVSGVEVRELTETSTDVDLPEPFYPVTTGSSTTTVEAQYVAQTVTPSVDLVAYDGFAGSTTITGDGDAKLVVTSTQSNGGLWSGRFFVGTGVTLESGEDYIVTATLHSNVAFEQFEILSSNGKAEDDNFNPWGNGYDQGDYGLNSGNWTLADDGTYTYTYYKVFTVRDDLAEYHELYLRFQVGNSPANNLITVDGISIQKWVPEHEEIVGGSTTDNQFTLEVNPGSSADATLTGNGSIATATVTTPSDDWHIKLYAKTGIELAAGETYRITFDVEGANGCDVCYKRAVEGGGEEDFGTEKVSSNSATIVHTVTPDESGPLEIILKIGNVSAGTQVKVSNVKVESGVTETAGDNLMTDDLTVEKVEDTVGENLMTDPLVAFAPVHEWSDAGYDTTLTHTDSSATLEIATVPEEQADWKVKMFVETGAELTAGKQYRISYDIEADESFDFNVFYNNGAEEKAVGEFYNLSGGDSQTISHVVSPSSDSVLNIQLMLGMSGAPNNVTVSNVKVEEIVNGTGTVGDHAPVNFWAHEDYAASLSNDDSSASIAITKVPAEGREAWKVKLFAETGAQLEAGKTYRVSVDVQATRAIDYEICYNNAEHEAQLGNQGGLQASSGKKTVTYTFTPSEDSELIIQFNLGNASGATTFTISNVKVEEADDSSSENAIPDFACDSVGYLSKASDDGYVTTLEKNNASATYRITHAPDERHAWNAKVIVRTGVTPTPGKGYRISFDIDAAKPQNLFEVFYDGNEELAYGAQYEQYLAAGRNSFSYTIMPGDNKGEIVLQLRFGETNDTYGDTYTISNFKIEEVDFLVTQRPEIKKTCEKDTQPGYTAELTTTADRGILRLVETPADGLEAWKNKLFVNTGVTLEPGQKYRVSFNVKSIVPGPFEVCFNDGDVEKGLGGIFGLTSLPSGQYVEFVTYADKDARLVVQVSLGNSPAPNTIFVSDVKVEKAGDINLVSDTIYTF